MTERIELWTNAAQRAEFEDLAELFAILRTTELLETAYARDALDVNEYREACSKLITQFKNTEKALLQRGTIESTAQFIRKYNVDCPRAVERMNAGVPESTLGSGLAAQAEDNTKMHLAIVREMTEQFIYLSNLLAIGHTAADQLTPQLEVLLKTLSKAKALLKGGFDPASLESWLKILQQMRASDVLDEDSVRQFQYDLNNAKVQIDEILSNS